MHSFFAQAPEIVKNLNKTNGKLRIGIKTLQLNNPERGRKCVRKSSELSRYSLN